MIELNYLQRVAQETPTQFWNDSAEPVEIQAALANGGCGVTTNPILITKAVRAHPARWREEVRLLAKSIGVEAIPHALTARVAAEAADLLLPVYQQTRLARGFVCAQVDPRRHDDTAAMIEEAVAFHGLRPNIAVKIPVTAAGLEAIEELAARGITTTATTSFTVPQVLAVAEAFQSGLRRRPGPNTDRTTRSFAVIMAGRLDDHLRDEVKAGRGEAPEEAIIAAGLAVAKRAYQLFSERRYPSTLLIGGMRGSYHVTELMGGDLVLTIGPAMQASLLEPHIGLRQSLGEPVAPDLLAKLRGVPDFRRAYEPEGMVPAEFAGFGASAKTQGQFIQSYESLRDFVLEATTG